MVLQAGRFKGMALTSEDGFHTASEHRGEDQRKSRHIGRERVQGACWLYNNTLLWELIPWFLWELIPTRINPASPEQELTHYQKKGTKSFKIIQDLQP